MREAFLTEIPSLPFAFFEEPAPASAPIDPARAVYVRWSEPYDDAAREAERRGWRVVRERRDHLAMVTRLDEVADALLALD